MSRRLSPVVDKGHMSAGNRYVKVFKLTKSKYMTQKTSEPFPSVAHRTLLSSHRTLEVGTTLSFAGRDHPVEKFASVQQFGGHREEFLSWLS